ncbi:DUF2157 domain-containing protein [Tumidithrix elongata RA019]|uniref:DUF2157 domain-containing protein n=1 Tax=Tumidithrix elongata BACA0141 TaxID=2716417 RepID=A0AAW9PY04_9CYAN|nr:DUF2157 domain-containing protein [Tumidithrix elongata RA019]
MLTEKFRRQLRQEADRWQAEALIAPEQYQQLAERYGFNALDANASSRFTMILIGLGSILLGLGAIAFVASNWQEMSREFRAILLLSALIGFNWLGFHLWQRTTRWQRLGQGFLILGALILGANIALMGQIFHINGELYGLFFLWGFGVLAMAYGLRFTPLGIMAILLIGLGYLFHWGNHWSRLATDEDVLVKLIAQQMLAIAVFVLVPLAYWCRSRAIGILAIVLTVVVYLNSLSIREGNFLVWTIREYMPIAAAFLFIPLAYWCRSRSIFLFALLATVIGLLRSVYGLNNFVVPGQVIWAIALTFPPAILWAYDDFLWRQRFLSERILPRSSPAFAHLAHGFSLVLLSAICYFQSFWGAWSWRSQDIVFVESHPFTEWSSLVNLLLFGSIATFAWWRLLQDSARGVVTKIVGGFMVVEIAIVLWHGSLTPIPEIATFTYNVLLFLISMGLIRISLEKSQRIPFWAGIFLIVLQVVSRLFEYDTGLLLKSFIFALCGTAVILAGLWFERHLKLLAVGSASSSQAILPSSFEERP